MARARNIKPGFFKNEELAECSMAARLLFAGLWTLADREGRLEDRPKRIKADTLPYDDVDCDKLLNELVHKKFIKRYAVGEGKYIQISKFVEHQNPHNNESVSVIPSPTLSTMAESPSNHGAEHSGLTTDSLTTDSLTTDSLISDSVAFDAPTPEQIPEKPEKKKGSRLPSDWTLPDAWGDWAMQYCASKGLFDGKPFVIEQGVVFKNYWTAKTSQATKLDWQGTWENWIRRGLPDYQLKQKRLEREKSYEQVRRGR